MLTVQYLNEISRRYTSEALDFHFPDDWRLQSSNNKQCSEGSAESVIQQQFNQQTQSIVDTALQTYEQMVEAAEICPSRCIHPGKPWDKSEPDLEELVERAAPFNSF